MSLTIDGVPTQVTVAQVSELLAALGLNADGLRRLELLPRASTDSRYAFVAEVCALDEDGRKYVVDGELAVHTVVIPVVA